MRPPPRKNNEICARKVKRGTAKSRRASHLIGPSATFSRPKNTKNGLKMAVIRVWMGFGGENSGFCIYRLFAPKIVSGFVVAGPAGAGAVSPAAGLNEASYKNPNPPSAHAKRMPRRAAPWPGNRDSSEAPKSRNHRSERQNRHPNALRRLFKAKKHQKRPKKRQKRPENGHFSGLGEGRAKNRNFSHSALVVARCRPKTSNCRTIFPERLMIEAVPIFGRWKNDLHGFGRDA